MPAGKPVINTASSVPSPVPRVAAPAFSNAWHTRCRPQIMRRTPAVPTNEQRRATAKRKLERQLERRAARDRKRRIYTIVGSAVAAIVVIGAIVATIVITNKDSDSQTASAATTTSAAPTSAAPSGPGQLPAFTAPANLGGNCEYPATQDKA